MGRLCLWRRNYFEVYIFAILFNAAHYAILCDTRKPATYEQELEIKSC